MADVKKINGYNINDDTSRTNIGCTQDTYDNSKTYSIDDVVVYNNTIYKCITAVTAAEAFDSTKWQQICLRDLIIETRKNSSKITVVNSLESDSETEALSAKQGKILNEKMAGTVVYDDPSGTTENVALSKTSDNYKYADIFYVDAHSNTQNSKRIDLNVSKSFVIDGMAFFADTSVNYATNYVISGTSITVSTHGAFNRSYHTGAIGGEVDKNFVKIRKVIFYK